MGTILWSGRGRRRRRLGVCTVGCRPIRDIDALQHTFAARTSSRSARDAQLGGESLQLGQFHGTESRGVIRGRCGGVCHLDIPSLARAPVAPEVRDSPRLCSLDKHRRLRAWNTWFAVRRGDTRRPGEAVSAYHRAIVPNKPRRARYARIAPLFGGE